MNKLSSAIALLALSGSTAFGQVAVVASNPINVESGQAQAFAAVCAEAYRSASGQEVTIAVDVEAAKAQLVSEIIELNLIGLDGRRTRKILVNGKRRTPEGALVHAASIEAHSMEDAPTVCERLATALVRKEPVEATLTRTTVTEAESRKKTHRLYSNRSLGVKTGLAIPFAQTPTAPMGFIAFDGRFEGQRWFAQVGAGVLVPAASSQTPGYGGFTADLGANYYFTDTDFAPYIGAGLQPRLVFTGSFFNLVPYAQLGATFSRTSGVRFNLDLRVGQNVLPALNTSFTGSTPVYPTELSAHLGIGF